MRTETELQKNREQLAEMGLLIGKLDAECKQLRVLCARAADALECHNLDHLQDDLIADLRKAAE